MDFDEIVQHQGSIYDTKTVRYCKEYTAKY